MGGALIIDSPQRERAAGGPAGGGHQAPTRGVYTFPPLLKIQKMTGGDRGMMLATAGSQNVPASTTSAFEATIAVPLGQGSNNSQNAALLIERWTIVAKADNANKITWQQGFVAVGILGAAPNALENCVIIQGTSFGLLFSPNIAAPYRGITVIPAQPLIVTASELLDLQPTGDLSKAGILFVGYFSNSDAGAAHPITLMGQATLRPLQQLPDEAGVER